jgi:hypothetical protein
MYCSCINVQVERVSPERAATRRSEVAKSVLDHHSRIKTAVMNVKTQTWWSERLRAGLHFRGCHFWGSHRISATNQEIERHSAHSLTDRENASGGDVVEASKIQPKR